MRDEFIVDLWSRIKHLIPAKERLEAADVLVAVCDEYGYADGIEDYEDLDKELRAAVKSHFSGFDEDDEDEEYENYDD